MGNDAKLLPDESGEIQTATLAEKLLLTGLVKMSNFVPDGGVWLNTQRPEWNDANNALVGYGLSIVTTCYLRRYLSFLKEWLVDSGIEHLNMCSDISLLLKRIQLAICPYVEEDKISISSAQRHQIVSDLSAAGSKYRDRLYDCGLSNERNELPASDCIAFLNQCLRLLDNTIESNRRADGLYHSYNLMSLDVDGEIHIERLYEMLEGQVAVLSSGVLSPSSVAEVLNALRASALYREDQQSYMLYPNRGLAAFHGKERNPIRACKTVGVDSGIA